MSNTNHNIDLNALYNYRKIRPTDYQVIKALHEEFFPVRYVDQFYEDAVEGKGIGGDDLYTVVVTTKTTTHNCDESNNSSSSGGGGIINTSSFPSNASKAEGYKTCDSASNDDSMRKDDEVIIGFLFGQFMSTDMCEEKYVFDLKKKPKKMFYILTLGVRKEYRNMGLASHLVQKSIQVAKLDQSCGIVYLHVIHYNKAAIKMYENNNFEFLKTMTSFYKINNEYYDSYLYGIFLNGYEGEFMMKLTNIVRKNAASIFSTVMVAFVGLYEQVRKTFSIYENPSLMQAVAGEVSDVVDCHGKTPASANSRKMETMEERKQCLEEQLV